MLKPLGMYEVRSRRLRKMSRDFLTWDGEEASDLHGIGKYGSDSYKIFYKNEIPEDVQDKELKKYITKNL
jgi:methyl-CpG-binding domain protein 4